MEYVIGTALCLGGIGAGVAGAFVYLMFKLVDVL